MTLELVVDNTGKEQRPEYLWCFAEEIDDNLGALPHTLYRLDYWDYGPGKMRTTYYDNELELAEGIKSIKKSRNLTEKHTVNPTLRSQKGVRCKGTEVIIEGEGFRTTYRPLSTQERKKLLSIK